MVDLTPNANGHATTRLLDLVPGRSGKAYQDWLDARGQSFRSGVTVATLDPFHGYKNAIDERLEDARAVLDAFHVVKLANQAVDDVRRRVQQDTLGHRGRKGDLLYGIRNILRAGHENLTQRQQARLDTAFAARLEHVEVELAYRCAQQVRAVYHQTTLTAGRALAQTVIDSLPGCPVPEIARLGRTSNNGPASSSATSTPTAPATAAPKPSTDSSNSTAASPAASATATLPPPHAPHRRRTRQITPHSAVKSRQSQVGPGLHPQPWTPRGAR